MRAHVLAAVALTMTAGPALAQSASPASRIDQPTAGTTPPITYEPGSTGVSRPSALAPDTNVMVDGANPMPGKAGAEGGSNPTLPPTDALTKPGGR